MCFNNKKRKVSQSGFTLVELLVVISIIAMLLAVLLPSLNAARERARLVVCGSHVRQLDMATQIYIQKTGYFPVFGEWRDRPYPQCHAYSDPWVTSSGEQKVTDWFDEKCFGTPMSALIKTRCVDDISFFIGACPTSKNKVQLSYAYNYGNLGGSSTPYGDRKNGSEWIKMSSLLRPSETGMYCDGTTVGTDLSKYPREGHYGIMYWEPKYWPDYVKPASGFWSDPQNFTKQQIIGHLKGTRIMIGFADGHAAAVPVKECHGTYSYDYNVSIWLRDKSWRPGGTPPR